MLDVAFRVTNFQPRGICAVNAKQNARFAFGIGNDQLGIAVLRFQLGAFNTLTVLVFREWMRTAINDTQAGRICFPIRAFDSKNAHAIGRWICRLETDKWAVCEWKMSGMQRGDMPNLTATHKAFSIRGVSILELQAGKIRRCTDYWDMSALHKQLR